MLIQFSFNEKIEPIDFNISKIRKNERYSLINSFWNNENKTQNHDFDLLDY